MEEKSKEEVAGNGAQGTDEVVAFFQYLASTPGHELAARIVTLIESIKKVTLDRMAENQKLNLELAHKYQYHAMLLQGGVFGVTIVAASVLTYLGKLDSTIAVLFGTLVGYFFGRKSTA